MLKVPGQTKVKRKHKVKNPDQRQDNGRTKMRFERVDPVTGRTRIFYAHPRGKSKRSDHVEAPHLIGANWSDYQSTVTGEIITGRRQHREHLEKHDLIEVGTENMQERHKQISEERIKQDKDQRLKTIVDTYDQLEQGREAAEIETTDVAEIPEYGEVKHYSHGETDFADHLSADTSYWRNGEEPVAS